MPVTTLSSREFNQDAGRAKRLAKSGPVFVTDRGRPSHVLLTIEAFEKLTGDAGSIVDKLGWPAGVEDTTLDIPPRREIAGAADLD